MNQILALDPQHPGALFARGDILKALRIQEARGGLISDLLPIEGMDPDRPAMEKIPSTEINYFRGKLALEKLDLIQARTWFEKVLVDNPGHFSALLCLAGLIVSQEEREPDRDYLEGLRKKIKALAMEKVVADAWQSNGGLGEFPSWKAPFRLAQKGKLLDLRFLGKAGSAWGLYSDGLLIHTWGGPVWKGSVPLSLSPGEHIFVLVGFQEWSKFRGESPPFQLELAFR